MQTSPNRRFLVEQPDAAFGFVSKLAIAFSIVYAMRLSPASAILLGLIFASIFLISGSVARGLTNLFLAIALCSVLSTILFFLNLEIDRPSVVFLFTACIAVYFSSLKAKPEISVRLEEHCFDLITGSVLIASSVLFRQLTNLENTKLFGMLLPEDNAAWIHASSGFLRFDASAGLVTSMQYGSGSFSSVLFSFFSVPTKLLSTESGPVLSLVNVANTYMFLILVLAYMSSVTCRDIFHKTNRPNTFENIISNGKFALIGVLSILGVGKVFLNTGHLSLILAAGVIWVVTYQIHHSAKSLNTLSDEKYINYFNAFLLSAYALGVAWIPLIPISVLIIVSILLILAFKNKFLVFNPQKAPRKLAFALNLILFLSIILAAFSQLRIPNGYSVSSLVNVGSGGTLTPTVIALSISIIGIILTIEHENENLLISIYLSLFPLCLLGYWFISFSEMPTAPGYSVEKFSLLVSLIGLPLFLGYIFSNFERSFKSKISHVVSPILFSFALLHASWGINSFPRIALLDKSNWTINFMSSLINQAQFNQSAQLLCLSPNLESDMVAYTCSRFGSALQFREFSNNNLARRWRSQILNQNVDEAVFPKGTEDFKVPSNMRAFVENGGQVIVILTPGPFWQIEQRLEHPWMQDLPWTAIKIVE
jgi:hypothetical protein